MSTRYPIYSYSSTTIFEFRHATKDSKTQFNMGHHDIITEHAEQASNIPEKSGDIATLLVNADSSNITVTPELNRRCLLRIDLILMPIMFISFGIQYMDKSCLTGAALFGIVEDLNLYKIVEFDGQPALDLSRYSYTSLIFYWGFLLGCRSMKLIYSYPFFYLMATDNLFESDSRSIPISAVPTRKIYWYCHYTMGRCYHLHNYGEKL
jgi:hypothetical protein